MPILCGQLKPLQRRSIQLFGANLALTAVLALIIRDGFKQAHLTAPLLYLAALLPTIPVIGIVTVVGRYLARETDEYIRAIVVQSLLWGLGITFVVDTYLGGLLAYPALFRLIPILNIDLFCVSGMLALRIRLWSSR